MSPPRAFLLNSGVLGFDADVRSRSQNLQDFHRPAAGGPLGQPASPGFGARRTSLNSSESRPAVDRVKGEVTRLMSAPRSRKQESLMVQVRQASAPFRSGVMSSLAPQPSPQTTDRLTGAVGGASTR